MTDPKPPAWLRPVNKVLVAVQKLGIVAGPVRVLTVPGRKSGEPRSTPATPFTLNDGLYVVGGYPKADWVLNARAAGTGTVTGAASRSVSASSNSAPSSLARCCARFPKKSRQALASLNARGW